MRIVINLDETFFGMEKEMDVKIKTLARHILMDALGEFQSNRGPTSEEYVNRRYPDNKDYAWLNREDKIRQVQSRKVVAEIIRNSDISVEW